MTRIPASIKTQPYPLIESAALEAHLSHLTTELLDIFEMILVECIFDRVDIVMSQLSSLRTEVGCH